MRSSGNSKQEKYQACTNIHSWAHHTIPKYIIFKLIKATGKNSLKESQRKRHITYTKMKIIIKAEFSSEAMQTRNQWCDIFELLKGKILSTQNFVLSKNIFKKF